MPGDAAPGFVADCNGSPVLRCYLGDGFRDGPGTTTRAMRPDPIHAPTLVHAVTLDCESLDWDTDPGNATSASPDDPRTGAATLANGQCDQITFAQALGAGAYFWGRGTTCAQVPGVAPRSTLVGCQDGEVALGLPVQALQPNAYDPNLTVLRQPVPAGIHSISGIRFIGIGANTAAANTVSVTGWAVVGAVRRPEPTTGLAVRVTVRFRDGGAPLVVDRMAATAPYGPAGDQAGLPTEMKLFIVNGILPESSREVLSVSVQAMPEGLDCVSSMRTVRWAGRPLAAGDAGEGAEFSKDGGATWSPAMTADGSRYQAALCIVR